MHDNSFICFPSLGKQRIIPENNGKSKNITHNQGVAGSCPAGTTKRGCLKSPYNRSVIAIPISRNTNKAKEKLIPAYREKQSPVNHQIASVVPPSQ
jgi:hypothetical protein